MILEAIPTQVKSDWSLLLMRVQWLDILFVIMFVLGAFVGLKRGLGKVISRFLEVIVAQVITVEYYEALADFLAKWVPAPIWILQTIVFGSIAVALIIAIRFLFQVFSFVATVEFKPAINNIGGTVLGALQFILFLGLLSSFLLLIPVPLIQEAFSSNSLSGPYLAQTSKQVNKLFTHWLPKTLPEKPLAK